jgi:cardiolipin synthase A/B
MSSPQVTSWTWLRSGDEAFAAMLAAIDAARQSIRLEVYIFSSGSLGQSFREALVKARRRGVSVRVLVDAVGSLTLLDDFWIPLREAGGEARFFNPLALHRFEIRNHRKLLVCDDSVALVGGFNIAPEYEGDGVERGWRDLGLRLEGPLVSQLALSFDRMCALAEFRHKRLPRFRRAPLKLTVESRDELLLLGGPGRGRNPIKRLLHADLSTAQNIRIMVGYFLPTGHLRRDLSRAARRGKSVRLLLAGKSDVPLSQLAGQSLYRRLLKSGVEIHEYTPQILHAKLFVMDDAVYVGSANLDPRSLSINYELMIRFQNARMAGEAREIFDDSLRHCRRIELEEWLRTRTFWARLKRRWAYFFLARIDPYVARRQWRSLPG